MAAHSVRLGEWIRYGPQCLPGGLFLFGATTKESLSHRVPPALYNKSSSLVQSLRFRHTIFSYCMHSGSVAIHPFCLCQGKFYNGTGTSFLLSYLEFCHISVYHIRFLNVEMGVFHNKFSQVCVARGWYLLGLQCKNTNLLYVYSEKRLTEIKKVPLVCDLLTDM